jgi:Spy/CpxP family protein refolding chaperone
MIKSLKLCLAIGASCLLISGWQAASSLAKDLDNVASASVSDEDDNWPKCIRKHLEHRFFKSIDATPEQRVQLAELIENTAAENKPAVESAKQELLSLIDAFADNQVTNDQLRQKVADLRKTHEAIMDKRLDAVLKARDILTAKQRRTASDNLTKKVKRFLNHFSLSS